MRDINIYNTLTKKVDKFVPNEPGKVKMYTCGPTVYHFAHIGNLRSYLVEDILEKYLRYAGYDVKRVMKDGGVFITSGIIHDRVDMVCEKLEATGFEVIEKNRDGEWNCIVAKLK